MRKKSQPGSSSLSRREFGKRLGLVTGAGIVPSACVVGAAVESHAAGFPLDQNDPVLPKLSAEGRLRFDPAIPFSAPPESEDCEFPIDSRQPDAISSLCGLPAITVPCGFSDARLPLGVQFLGRALNDHAVIAAARLFQTHTDWHTKRPPIA